MDLQYSSPNDAALAVVATAMKKSRLKLHILLLNSIVGGALFSSGGFLYVGFNSENPKLVAENPGIGNFVGAVFYGIGLFYVIITGADLFNSNILFFTVGLLRGAVTIYDLLISWFVSWLGNIAGTLFAAYVFLFLSGSGATAQWSEGSRQVLESKASFSFIQVFLKGIAGNFYVCLAVYLQMMAKPIHVRYIMASLPIFTFVSLGYTHVVADMAVAYIGLLNGADVSVGKYIWKLLVPGSIGNIIGGSAFGIIIPYFMHIVVVEMDKKELAIPEYEARDEHPELNTDSRVVRLKVPEADMDTETDTDAEAHVDDDVDEKNDTGSTMDQTSPYRGSWAPPPDNSSIQDDSLYDSADTPKDFRRQPSLSRTGTHASRITIASAKSRAASHIIASPPGVFPILGMGKAPLKERQIQSGNYKASGDSESLQKVSTQKTERHYNRTSSSQRSMDSNESKIYSTTQEIEDFETDKRLNYDVTRDKPGAALKRAVTNTIYKLTRTRTVESKLPQTTQDMVVTDNQNMQTMNPSSSQASINQSIESYLSYVNSSID
ncbi:hypothetical protein TPHA_0C04240 [Tetrapisispora phaffii CBS 4417]|uniref:Formate/nitrite transporter n=1 Tax=Tetrapisispora phaffii (strain ATCC 24235 / CBS 4417 / NBRC 1672 / NRRL Y-8282 / UCD 70-5) TaxID=1071381 RepID=G8BQR2_TETPH|nr:hypothetical protein TPHA_0C04240 [Tetrapisispora phaffii CBS 4417]CCE62574.1 hypothetical protein TPHA_0C04240 [Tetrapisispora phaffii CBS 4417]